MHPAFSAAVAASHTDDLIRSADRSRRAPTPAAGIAPAAAMRRLLGHPRRTSPR